MKVTDSFVNGILKSMGCDPNKPARWIPRIYRAIDQTTKEVVREYEDGWLCSKCGKHSWSRCEVCDGCNSTMQNPKGGTQ